MTRVAVSLRLASLLGIAAIVSVSASAEALRLEEPAPAFAPSGDSLLPATTVVNLHTDGSYSLGDAGGSNVKAACGGRAPKTSACDAGLFMITPNEASVLTVQFPACPSTPSRAQGGCFAGTITMELRPHSRHLRNWSPVNVSCTSVAVPGAWLLVDCGTTAELAPGVWALTCTIRPTHADPKVTAALGEWQCAYAEG